MALTPVTDEFSQFLRLAFLRSPNFLTGVSGWTINQDGSAEFNSLTVRNGQIISGVFLLYSSATPAKGNLICSIAATAGTDTVGNNYGQGLNIGMWSAVTGNQTQHFGVDDSGRVYIVGPDGVIRVQINNGTGGTGPDIRFFNDFGAVILVVDPSRGGTFQYQDNNSAVQGVLIGAQVGKNTTDPVNGTAVGAGITLSDPAFGDQLLAVGANISLTQALFTRNAILTANTGGGATSPFLHLAGPEQGHAGHAVMRMYGVSADGTVAQGVIISGTDPPVRAAAALLEIQGSTVLTGIAAPASPPAGNALLFADTSGLLRTLAGLAGDTNAYFLGAAHLFAKNVSQPISSPVATTITGLSCPVGIGTYRIRARLVCTQGASANSQNFSFSGPAVANARWSCTSLGASSTVIGVSSANNISGTMASGAFGAGVIWVSNIDGWAQFSAAGTLALQAAAPTTSFTVVDGTLDVEPAI